MKIAYIGQKGFPGSWGGVEVHVHNVAVGLAARSHEVVVFNRSWYGNQNAGSKSGVQIVDTPCLHTKHMDAISHSFTSSIAAAVKDFDIVHYHCMGPSLMSWIPRIGGKRIVTTIHGFDYSASKWGRLSQIALRLGEWTALNFSHATIVVAKHMRDHYRRLGWNPILIPNGVTPVEHVPFTRDSNPWQLDRGRYFLFLARLEENKGAHLLVDSFKECKRRGMLAGVQLVVAGGHVFDSAYSRRLDRENTSDILFVGHVEGERKNALLANALAFVTPSSVEGMPIAILEAMSAGLPIIASDIPAHREMLEATGNALLYDHKANDGLTSALLAFSALNTEATACFSHRGKAVARAYTWENTVQQLEALYSSALATG